MPPPIPQPAVPQPSIPQPSYPQSAMPSPIPQPAYPQSAVPHPINVISEEEMQRISSAISTWLKNHDNVEVVNQ
ncbi:hypothetical protein OSTOST_23561 [Ostertagia ostertagi]